MVAGLSRDEAAVRTVGKICCVVAVLLLITFFVKRLPAMLVLTFATNTAAIGISIVQLTNPPARKKKKAS